MRTLNYCEWCKRFGCRLTKPQKRIGYSRYLKEHGVKDLIRMEVGKTERNAWKVRSYMANKLRQ